MSGDVRTGDFLWPNTGDDRTQSISVPFSQDNTANYYYVTVCPYCGGTCIKPEECPRVKAIEYHENGQVKRVKLREKKPAAGTITAWSPGVPTC